MFTRLYLLMFLFLSATQVLADERMEIAKCTKIKSIYERVTCYDAIARNLGVNTLEKKALGYESGAWKVEKENSKIDDSRNVLIWTRSADSPSIGNKKIVPTLNVACQENKTMLYIDWNNYLGTRETKVTFRIDKRKASVSNWAMSTNNQAVFYPGRK